MRHGAVDQAAFSAMSLGFVATKPIQIITSMILARQFSPRRCGLCVVPLFADASGFLRRVRDDRAPFDSVTSAHSRASAIISQALGHDRVLIDSDVGAKSTAAMWLAHRLRPRVRFALYEEGTSLFDPLPIERPSDLHVRLGATARMGTGALTEEVWTYSPEDLRAKLATTPVRQIETSVSVFVLEHHAHLARLFWPSRDEDTRHWRGTRCCVYLSSYQVDKRALAYLKRSSAYTVLKLHPHFRSDSVAAEAQVDQRVPAGIPAELIVYALAATFDSVEVLHDGSTIERYVQAPNVRFVRTDTLTALPTEPTSTPPS